MLSAVKINNPAASSGVVLEQNQLIVGMEFMLLTGLS